MDPVIIAIRNDFKENADPIEKEKYQRFFKEEAKFYGVKMGQTNKIANKYWKEIKHKKKNEIFDLCEELYRSGYCEEAFIVSSWVPKLKDQFIPEDFDVFQRWVDQYISNWAECDGFCNHTVGDFIEKYPEYVEKLKSWVLSSNRWVKRGAAVSLIVPARHGKYLKQVFEVSDLLLEDKDDMVQKGYGWLLKEASRLHQKEVYYYVIKNKKMMPRTALHYAIELMPKELKMEAMKKDW
ncbi:DNA alkylation repair protein [Candidatus Bathyarchaeota archaeon]|nr:DNA alkylation repair protein [Candidatus Bathyarchaeota archaeon]